MRVLQAFKKVGGSRFLQERAPPTYSRKKAMAELEVSLIIVIVLASVLGLLLCIFLCAFLVVLKTKRLLCFKRNVYRRPFLLSDRELAKRSKGSNRLQKIRGPVKGKKPTYNYQSIGRAVKFPKRDPFANKFLENPMVSVDDLDMDWTNPAFDETRALKFEAAIAIQSWYRMCR